MQDDGVRTVGVDLAAEPTKTAVAVLDWNEDGAVVDSLVVGADDDLIVAAATGASTLGLDAPLGWPEPFLEFLRAQRDGRPLPPTDLAGRRRLAFRETDRAVTSLTRLRPLSVAADRIGHAAMRAAGLVAALGSAGHPTDRDGTGFVLESYPAAALKRWGLAHTGYKGADNTMLRAALVTDLVRLAPRLRLGEYADLCRASDDAFDAVICGLIARASALRLVHQPTPEQERFAVTEGWIVVPDCEIGALFQGPES
jgi:predicted nuclease with RNAse H fold